MKKPLSIMVWVGLTVNGATKPYFLKKGPFLNIKKILKEKLK